MNAERDVERLLSTWLADEAAVRAPDRVLETARRTIDRTMQRRFVAAWREPVNVTTTKVAALAAALMIALGGAAWIGRVTAPSGPAGPNSTPTVSPGATPVGTAGDIDAFRAAYSAICTQYMPLVQPLNDALGGLYDAGLSATDRAVKVDAFRQLRMHFNRMLGELQAIPVPPPMAVDVAVALAAYDARNRLIGRAIERLDADDLAGAQALDLATDPSSARIQSFERQYALTGCP